MKRLYFLTVGLCCMLFSGCLGETEQYLQEVEGTYVSGEENMPEEMDAVEHMLQAMTLEEKVGQLFFADIRGAGHTEMSVELQEMLDTYHVGGIILFGENIVTGGQTKTLIQGLQAGSKYPLFIGVDEEGGIVSRMKNIWALEVPKASEIGTTEDPKEAYFYGAEMGKELSAYGFNVDFAPVCDVNTNPNNPVIGSRSFGDNPDIVTEMALSLAAGLAENNVNPCLKHFPGHGDTKEDTHDGLVTVDHDLERLQAVELLPFQLGVENGVPFVMVSHITLPNVQQNPMPSSLSKEIINILKIDMGFEGIVITDAMDMGAITKHYSCQEAAVTAFQAGNDMILIPQDLAEAYHAILQGVQDGSISAERLDESVRKILTVKRKSGLL